MGAIAGVLTYTSLPLALACGVCVGLVIATGNNAWGIRAAILGMANSAMQAISNVVEHIWWAVFADAGAFGVYLLMWYLYRQAARRQETPRPARGRREDEGPDPRHGPPVQGAAANPAAAGAAPGTRFTACNPAGKPCARPAGLPASRHTNRRPAC